MEPNGAPALIDPTKNVLDLVHAEGKYRDSLRDSDTLYQNAMREAETRRVNDLAAQKEASDTRLSNLLRQQGENASSLLAAQLASGLTAISDRVAKLEQFRWESGGRGIGVSAAAGWVLSVIMAGIALFALFIKN